MIKFFLTVLISLLTLQVQAFEDCIITNSGKLTDISIEDNTVINVYPIITIMNNKNTLIVTPLKEGKTRFCVLKNNKEKIMFNVEVTKNKTIIDEVKNFEILSLDVPPSNDFVLDEPPMLRKVD